MDLRIFSVLCFYMVYVNASYVNNFDQTFTFQCPFGQSISRIAAYHSNHHEDRRFSFSCNKNPGIRKCQWHGYANEWDQPLNFQCPGHSVISGVSSYHSNHREDRRFKFYCCSLKDKKAHSCRFGDYANYWDAPFNYIVPVGHVLRGAFSFHSNYREDRRWRFETCVLR